MGSIDRLAYGEEECGYGKGRETVIASSWIKSPDLESSCDNDCTAEVPFARPWITQEDIDRVVATIRSGWVMQGPAVAEFETVFAATVEAPMACAVSSCTAALHLALQAVGVGQGNVVLTVSHSFIATANSIRMCGAEPVFVDIDPVSLNMSPEALRRRLERDFELREGSLWYREINRLARGLSPLARIADPRGRLAAILLPHQAGMPADMKQILKVADEYGIPLVEDAACALGSEIDVPELGRRVPIGYPLGRIVCFSLHPRKVISTGEGGVITSTDSQTLDRIRILRQHGTACSTADRHVSLGPTFESYPVVGYNYKMTDIQAALGIGQLRRLREIVNRRRAIAAQYRCAFSHLTGICLPADPSFGRTNFQSYVVRVEGDGRARWIIQQLHARGISTRRGIMCAHTEPPYADLWMADALPESVRASAECLILPLFPTMTPRETDYVCTHFVRLLS